ncbi:MAG: L-rhamnose/proton symporter RhaT [Bacteroidales bacterium]|nr:L-rhamnose/proton symporter RhaT [Bacteroidales bacterium]
MLGGILLIALGSFSAASFYVPISKTKNIAWEVYWLMAGIFSWLIVPFLVAFATVPDLFGVYGSLESSDFVWPFIFGALWGVGGLTYGMTLRYLGVSLGIAIANGIISVFGTLVPPIYQGGIGAIISTPENIVSLFGVLVSIVGIAFMGMAGINKDKDISKGNEPKGDSDFNLKLGLIVAVVSGLMSACFSFGLAAAKPIAEAAVRNGAEPLYQGNAGLCIVLLGGLLVNLVYCLVKSVQNHTLGDWVKTTNTPVLRNWIFLIIGGSLWYFQMMFLEMGKSRMGDLEYTAWAILMSLTIVFSTAWGFFNGEWKGASRKTLTFVFAGIGILILSAIIIGIGPNIVKSYY